MALTKVNQRMLQSDAVSVLDYGADSTGTSDSSSAIQAAINAGSYIVFPPGTYLVTSTINVPSNKIIESLGATIDLQVSPCFLLEGNITSAPYTFVENVSIIGFTFQNNVAYTTTSRTAISAKSVKSIRVESNVCNECLLVGFTIKHDTFNGAVADPMGTYSIDTVDAMNQNLKVINNEVHIATKQTGEVYGIIMDFCVYASISNNFIEGVGIRAAGTNAVLNIAGRSDYFRNNQHQSYTGNVIRNGRAGIFLNLAENCVMSGNTVEDVFDVGFDLEGCKNCNVTGNTVINAGKGGLATFLVAEGNAFTGNTVKAVQTASRTIDRISLLGGSGNQFDANSKPVTTLYVGNVFSYVDETGSAKSKVLQLIPEWSHISLNNNIFQNVHIAYGSAGETGRLEFSNNTMIFDDTPIAAAISVEPKSSQGLGDGFLGCTIENNEFTLVSGATTTGTVAVEVNISDNLRTIHQIVRGNKCQNFETFVDFSGTLTRPGGSVVTVEGNYTDGAFANTHNVNGAQIFLRNHNKLNGTPYYSDESWRDTGYIKEASLVYIDTVAPSGSFAYIATNTGYYTTDAYATSTAYESGDVVVDPTDATKVWVCLQDGTTGGSAPTPTAFDFNDGTTKWRRFDLLVTKAVNTIAS